MAEHFHIFWYCHLLQKMLGKYIETQKILSVEIPKDPVQFTLGVPSETLIHKDYTLFCCLKGKLLLRAGENQLLQSKENNIEL